MSGSVGPPLLVLKASQRSSARMLKGGGNTHDNYHDVIEYNAVGQRVPFDHPPMNSLQNVDVPSIENGGRPLYSPSPTDSNTDCMISAKMRLLSSLGLWTLV